jgi:hypothetical protein
MKIRNWFRIAKKMETRESVNNKDELDFAMGILSKYGFNEDEVLYDEEQKLINIQNVVLLLYDRGRGSYVFSFSPAATPTMAAQIVDFFHKNNINNILFSITFYIDNDEDCKIYFGPEAKDRYQQKIEDDIALELLRDQMYEDILKTYNGKTIH